MNHLLLQKIDELEAESVFDTKAQKILYALEFAIRQLEDRIARLEGRQQPTRAVGEKNI
jgi:D-serine deaminase-like pyridoxal phosphate-dependent protein